MLSGPPPKRIKIASMDFRQIQDLVKMINKSNIGELSIEEKDFKITIKQKKDEKQVVYAPAPQSIPGPVYPPPAAIAGAGEARAGEERPSAEGQKADNLITIKSPMIGTFYRRPSPDKPIFAEVGDDVAPGKVVCIIEAMKLFNEIESEVSGRIVKILVEDASPVEYDQPLFLVEPS
jgi:acetyl-CoA carboxylase biotin carboxyl carrier protein